MPASTLDPVSAAIRNSLTKAAASETIDIQLAGATKKALLADIEFEAAGSYQTTVLDKLKNKYIVLKSSETQQTSGSGGGGDKMGADETLTLAKHELYPLEAVQLGWNSTDWAVGAGMVNMGNTCYLNSTLQALFHVPALVNWLVSDKQHMSQCEDSGGLCIICAMRKTLQDSQQRNTNSIRPFLIYNKLRVVCRNLIPGRQEDAHEFLRYLVEAMEKAYLSRFKNHTEFDSRTKETTPLNQILGGYLRSAVRCLECSHVSTTFQHFQDLLLDIRKAQTLEEALDGYFSREKLDDESYHCESCQKKVPATKQFSLERAPMVLCIQLKRFSVSNNKITKHIQFRQRLDLTKYARHRASVPLVYRFVALVTHMGPTVGCGHYTAVAQAPCGNYYQFDDSMVRPISHQAVFNTNAYIMLYELECPPFLPKNNGNSSKIKTATVSNNSNMSVTNSTSITNNNSINHRDNNNKENSATISTNNKIQLNGSRVYGPELPPKLETRGLSQNGTITSSNNGNNSLEIIRNVNNNNSSVGNTGNSSNNNNNNSGSSSNNSKKLNGNSSSQCKKTVFTSSSSSSSSSSDSDTEQKGLAKSSEGKSKKSKTPYKSSTSKIGNVAFPANGKSSESTAIAATSQQSPLTKLVPYDVDDDDEEDGDNEEDGSSTCSGSDDVEKEKSPKVTKTPPPLPPSTETATISTLGTLFSSNKDRIGTCGDWQVTSSTDGRKNGPSNEGKSWLDKDVKHTQSDNKIQSRANFTKDSISTAPPPTSSSSSTTLSLSFTNSATTSSASTVNELLKMSHAGYSAPVSSWNGTRARLDKEINDERREDRKRSLSDSNIDQGRVKHPKTNENGYKSNPGYNRIQEYHNAKNNWNQNNSGVPTSNYNNNNGSRQFYNTSGKHRNSNRRNGGFHHKNNYHKNNYSFRQ